jgi:hypothetical protein
MEDVVKSELFFEGDEMVHRASQPTEDLILERNNELRKNEGALNDLHDHDGETWGRQVASIPFIIWYKAIKDGFDLNNPKSEVANKELHRFLQSEDGKKCLVGNHSHKVYSGGIYGVKEEKESSH